MKKILIIRCLQTELILQFISSLDQKVEIYILDNLKQTEIFNKQIRINKIFNLKKKSDFSLFNIKLKTLMEIRKKKLDDVIIPHKQKNLIGLENVIFMCLFFKSKKINHFQFFHGVKMSDLVEVKRLSFFSKMILGYVLAITLFPFTLFFLIIMILFGLVKKN